MVHVVFFAAVLCVLAGLSNAYTLGGITVTTTALSGGRFRVKATLTKKMNENIGWTAVCFGTQNQMGGAQCVAGVNGAISRWATVGKNFQAVSGANGDFSDATYTQMGSTVTLQFTASSLSGTQISTGFSKILASAGRVSGSTPMQHSDSRKGIANFSPPLAPTKKPTKQPTPRPTRNNVVG